MLPHRSPLRPLAALAAGLGLLGALPSARACDLPPPAVRTLDVPRFYADRAGTVVDPVQKALQQRGTAPVRAWLTHVVKNADSSLRQSSSSMAAYKAQCALEWIEAWARRGALLGTMRTKQAEAERRWTLAGTALAYLKLRPHANPEQRRVIAEWLRRVAVRARTSFAAGGAKPNNHLYWLGLGLGATALATGDENLWTAARSAFQRGIDAIDTDGTLPLERARGPRALHYHVFAAMPLVTLAGLATWSGREDLGATSPEGRRLATLVARTRAGLADPASFDSLIGIEQERPVRPGAGWLQIAASLAPSDHALPEPESPAGHRWLGGNVRLLQQALSRPTSDGTPPLE